MNGLILQLKILLKVFAVSTGGGLNWLLTKTIVYSVHTCINAQKPRISSKLCLHFKDPGRKLTESN